MRIETSNITTEQLDALDAYAQNAGADTLDVIAVFACTIYSTSSAAVGVIATNLLSDSRLNKRPMLEPSTSSSISSE